MSPYTEPQRPLTRDKIEREMEDHRYGVPNGVLGMDAELGYACITKDRRRAIAAACARWRTEGNGKAHEVTVEGPLWVQFFNHCGCPDHEPDPEADHDDCDCTHWGLPPCHAEELGWVYAEATEDALNSVPLYRVEVTD